MFFCSEDDSKPAFLEDLKVAEHVCLDTPWVK